MNISVPVNTRAQVVDAVLRGDRITLRLFTFADVTTEYVGWLNDPEVNRYLESRFVEQTLDSTRAFVERTIADSRTRFFAVIEGATGRHIGNLKLGPMDPHHGTASIGYLIGDRSAWGKGYATEAVGLASRYAFDALAVRKLTAGAYAPNVGSMKALLRNGFVADGVRRLHHRDGEGYVDLLLFAKFRDGMPSSPI